MVSAFQKKKKKKLGVKRQAPKTGCIQSCPIAACSSGMTRGNFSLNLRPDFASWNHASLAFKEKDFFTLTQRQVLRWLPIYPTISPGCT